MEDILRKLQAYQIEAFRRGVSCDLNLNIDGNQIPEIVISMYYSVTNEVIDNRNFRTTFSNDDKIAEMKLGRIRKFINNIEKEND